MPHSRFVVDASPLILLSRVDAEWILHELGLESLVPAAVRAELEAGRQRDTAVDRLLGLEWLSVVPDVDVPVPILAWELGAGESQVLAHGRLRPGFEVVLDDRQGRRCAKSLGLRTVGTLGLVLRARREGKIPSARDVVTHLVREGMYLDPDLMDAALGEVGE